MRSYTVKELDALRQRCETKILYGRYRLEGDGPFVSSQYSDGQLFKQVEEMMRTHMMAGHVAEDLVDEKGWSG